MLYSRHGQYNLQGSSDKERILTDLGRQQVRGLRLDMLEMDMIELIKTVMVILSLEMKLGNSDYFLLPRLQ